MNDRATDFARQGLAAIAIAGSADAERALANVIRRAMVEAALQGVDAEPEAAKPVPPPVVIAEAAWPTIATGCVVAPRDVAKVAGITKATAYHRLRDAVELGHAVKERAGRYRLTATGAGLRAITRPDYMRVSDVR